MTMLGINAQQPGQPSPLGRLIGLGGPALTGLAGMIGGTDPAMLQLKVLEAVQKMLSGAGMPALFTGTTNATRDRMLLEFLTKTGQLGRVAGSMANPREYLMLLENAAKQINPVALMQRAQPIMQESPEGLRTGMMGVGSGAQIMQAIRSLIQAAGAGGERALLPLLAIPRGVFQQVLPPALTVGG